MTVLENLNTLPNEAVKALNVYLISKVNGFRSMVQSKGETAPGFVPKPI